MLHLVRLRRLAVSVGSGGRSGVCGGLASGVAANGLGLQVQMRFQRPGITRHDGMGSWKKPAAGWAAGSPAASPRRAWACRQ